MGDSSSDSEEFHDAEEFTPIKGHKRSSIKSIGVNETESRGKLSPSKLNLPNTSSNEYKDKEESQKISDENINVNHVVQDRRRFEELRRCMQDEDEDDTELATELPTYTMEHPFKIIANDAMSLQSTTSLGRIGRILSGAAESHPNITENKSPNIVVSDTREPSTKSDDQILLERPQNVLAMAEPDVIASTKANSLKSRAAGVSVTSASFKEYAQPIAPPRKKKRNKMYGSQSLSTTDGDNLSVCTNDTDEYITLNRKLERTDKPPPLDGLLNEQRLLNSSISPSIALPSPASTIESLTREFQDSLQMSQAKYDFRPHLEQSSSSSRSSTGKSMKSQKPTRSTSDDRDEYQYRIERGTGRTHSDTRPSLSSNVSNNSRNDSECRRRSTGDDVLPGNRTEKLTDEQILEKVTVLNLDTGERMPLSIAEQKIPQCINPLSLHIMRLTSEYRQNEEDNARETDEESESVCAVGADDDVKDNKQEQTDKQTTVTIKKKTEKLKRFFGSTMKRTVDAAKSLAQEVTHARHKEDVSDIVDDVKGEHNIKLKASNSHKGPYDFDGCVRYVQELQSGGSGAVWCCKWSWCGRLLATAGQDRLLRVWVTVEAKPTLTAMRQQFNPRHIGHDHTNTTNDPLKPFSPFCPEPFAIYEGHGSDLLDVAWSKNYFLLSSSMDKTVRLWHISQAECLCCFQHIDFVTAIAFHPRDDRYFLSGSLDGKLRLWDIPDKKVAVWNEVDGKTKLITAANFCQNGKFAVVGTYDGRCIFYTTDQLKYHTQIDVRSTRGKNSTGRKISGIEPMPNDDKILVTSNDSRIRLYDLRDLNLSCKYKGYVNISSQIKASFSHDGKYIVCGSENQCIYIWKTCHDYAKFTSVRRDRNDFWEGIKAHNALVTCAVFAPNPDHMIRMITEREEQAKIAAGEHNESVDNVKSAETSMVSSSQTGHVLVSADFNGCIKVFLHKAKPKHSSLPASALA